MSAAREEILARVRRSLSDVHALERHADVPRDYLRSEDLMASELIERFAERVRDYHATVRAVTVGDIAEGVAQTCAELGVRRVVVPAALPSSWRPQGPEVLEDDQLTATELDAIDGAITGCATAIAQTGTIVLDGQGSSGRRAITLVPDHHICIVTADQIVGILPEAIARLEPAASVDRLPITMISGPSATSDIELSRVEGVHGPRHLAVLIATL